jgi:hypothetical protein
VGGVTIIQHGIDHVNRAKANERIRYEMPTEWDALEIAIRLDATRLQGMPNSIPMFVPPWHAVHPCLETALRTTGFEGWSAYGGDIQQSGELVRIDVHLEVLRWKADVRFRGEGRFMRRLTRLARERRRTDRLTEPIGILTHHLEHDGASWVFLERFIPWVSGNAAIDWRSLPELLEEARANGAIAKSTVRHRVGRMGEADAA